MATPLHFGSYMRGKLDTLRIRQKELALEMRVTEAQISRALSSSDVDYSFAVEAGEAIKSLKLKRGAMSGKN